MVDTAAAPVTVAQAGIDEAAQAAAAATATTAVNGTQASPGVSFEDEDAELLRLQALSKAEAEAGAGTTAAAAAKAPDGKAATVATAAPAPGATTAAPTAKTPAPEALTRVLIKTRRDNQILANSLAVEKGKNEILTAISRDKLNLTDEQLQAAGLPLPKDERTTEEKIVGIDTQLIQLAQDYDDAKLTASEWKRQETQLQNQKFSLQTESLRTESTHREPATDLGLEEHATQLETQFPVIAKLSEAQLVPFRDLAYEQATMEGKPIQDGTAVGTKDLRERMAKLATNFYGQPAAAAAPAAAAVTQPQPGAKPALSAEAQARADKLALSASHPANIAATGSGAPAGEVTDDVALQTLNSYGGDEEAQLRFLAANPRLLTRVTGQAPAK